jgi:hypothetical protein|tara:strand:- start:74 stop:586 length:513 start_codon:yes stop_codon:yes gene_type:complete
MIKLTDILNEDCWKGYKQVGGKMKNGKMVPNCVPESVEENAVDDHNDSSVPYGSGYDKMKEELSSKDRTLIYKLTTMALKAMPKSQKQKEIIKKLNFVRTKNGMKPLSEEVINEIGIFKISNYINGIIPSGMMNTVTRQNKERYQAVIRDLMQTLNQFWKRHNIPFRVRK